MGLAGWAQSPETLDRLLVLLLYMPAAVLLGWRLVPRLADWRWLARGMLLAQVLVIVLSLLIQPASLYEQWLWSIDSEGNIQSTLASMQLGLAGGVALMIAWLAKARGPGPRMYWLGVGLFFLFIGLDEFMDWKGALHDWQSNLLYAGLGLAIALATALLALRSPRRERLWAYCMLAGLALIALGGIALDALPSACSQMTNQAADCSLTLYTIEESLEFLGAWLALLAVLGSFGAVAGGRVARHGPYAILPLWLLLLFMPTVLARLELQPASPLDVRVESGLNLVGFAVDKDGDALNLRIYAAAETRQYLGLGYSLHLVDQASGSSVAQLDEWAQMQHGTWFLLPGYAHVYRHWTRMKLERRLRDNRAMWIVLSLWRERAGEFIPQRILASDAQLLDETQVVLDELVLPRQSSPRSDSPLARFPGGLALGGFDMPMRAAASQSLPIAFSWQADAAGGDDLIQFLHLIHIESGAWWGYDQQPLGPRLPTRLWYAGLADSETWHVPLPADLAPGAYTVLTGLYRHSDQQRLAATDATGRELPDASVPLGSLIIDA